MSLSAFKQDIDELLDEFVEGELTTLADMKKVWLSRKFTYIFNAMPSTKLALFMQSLYAHIIGYMVSKASLSRRLGGLYCLYCLYETQPFQPPFKIYLSLGELKKLKNLVVDAKEQGVKVVPTLVKRMLEKNSFLFGFVDINEASISETVNQLTELQNARVQHAYKKLFSDTHIDHFLHMDLGKEFDLNAVKRMSTEYAEAKKQAIQGASNEVDIQNIQHIANEKELIGNVMENIIGNWNVQKELFYQQTGSCQHPAQEQHQRQKPEVQNNDNDSEEYGYQLQTLLFQEEQQQKQEDEGFSHELELQLYGDEQEEQDDE